MKKFKNKVTGLVEVVTNPKLVDQYVKHTEKYEEVKSAPKKADK